MYKILSLIIFTFAIIFPVFANEHKGFICLNDDDNNFSYSFETAQDFRYTIERQNVDGPYYDGPSGYNVIKIRKEKKNSPCCNPDDILTSLVKGQYRLFGFDQNSSQIFAYGLSQYGAVQLIDKIVVFYPSNQNGKSIDLKSQFQYGTPSPDGMFCVLVNNGITIINLKTGKSNRLKIKEPIAEGAADPWEDSRIGGNANLSGEYMEILWTTMRSGRLIIKNKDGHITREIKIDLGDG